MLATLSLMLTLMLAQPAEVSGVESSSTAYFPPNLFLVKATTLDVKKAKPPVETGSFIVTHVYAGSNSLKGKTFECSTWTLHGFQIDNGYWDRHVDFLEKDTDGLWWVYLDKEKKLRPELRGDAVDKYGIRRFPITNGKFGTTFGGRYHDRKADWKEGLAWADAVETVYRAKSDEKRAVLLQGMAATEQSPVAAWAINLLGRVNPKGTTELLRKLAANEKLSADSHVVLDKTLSRLDSKWNSRDHWERLLTHWVNSRDLAYFNAGVNRLWEAGRNNEIDFALYSKILDPVLAKADKLKDGQEACLVAMLETPATFSRKDRDRAFNWLAGYVRDGKAAFVRSHAAIGLRVFGQLNPAQVSVIRILRKASTETEIQGALDTILKSVSE